jgi:3-phosphoshikimate 1-carboxyvinyltransferase
VPSDHKLVITPARHLRGRLRVPGDKSISHRYVLLAGQAQGTTEITNLAPGQDVAASLGAIEVLGAAVDRLAAGTVRVRGRGIEALRPPPTPIDAANSGTTLRLLTGIVSGMAGATVTLTGDASLSRRPMQRVIDPMHAMGARIRSADGRPPLVVSGASLTAVTWCPSVPSAQVKSAVLLAGLRAAGTTRVREPAATRDHTERAFPAFGLELQVEGLEVAVRGGQRPQAPENGLHVPGDPSSAAAWACAAAALPGSRVVLEHVSVNPRRIAFLQVLERMGARVSVTVDGEAVGEPIGTVVVEHGGHESTSIAPGEVPSLIDELPVLAARAALGGRLEVAGAGELRVKESDRITALVQGLRALGVAAEERPDGFVIDGGTPPTGGTAGAAHDHRLVMAFALVGLGAHGPTAITGADVVSVSYPRFAEDLVRLTA